MKTTTVHQRLDQLITALGLKAYSFAKELGVAPTQIYNCINGRNAPSFDLLSKIAITYPSVNIGWLLTGKGQVLTTDSNAVKEGINVLDKIKALEEQINKIASNQPRMPEEGALEVANSSKKKSKSKS